VGYVKNIHISSIHIFCTQRELIHKSLGEFIFSITIIHSDSDPYSPDSIQFLIIVCNHIWLINNGESERHENPSLFLGNFHKYFMGILSQRTQKVILMAKSGVKTLFVPCFPPPPPPSRMCLKFIIHIPNICCHYSCVCI
jgi:hypothetical protein